MTNPIEVMYEEAEKSLDKMHEYGMDAAHLIYTYTEDGITRYNEIYRGNTFAIQGMLDFAIGEIKAKNATPVCVIINDGDEDAY